jgi:membrane fusion protein (multidrug efflux system)
MSEPIQASDTPVSASTPKDPDAKSRRKRIILFSLLALTIAAAGGGYSTYWKRVGSRYVSTDDAYTAAEVAVVTAQIDGPVAAVNFVDSQQVKRGDILVVIDDTDAKLALRQAEADLARARAQVASATSDLERSGIDLQRRQALVASGSVSGDELTKVINGASDARASLNAARAAVALAQARVDKAKVDLGRTVIRSPIDGVIARREVQLGQRVQPSTPLLDVVPVSEMYVNANFKEVQLKKVRPGQSVELDSDLYGR